MKDQSMPPSPDEIPDRFHYFMLRLHSRGADSPVTGTVERLGTGEKRTFETAESLIDVLRTWVHTQLRR